MRSSKIRTSSSGPGSLSLAAIAALLLIAGSAIGQAPVSAQTTQSPRAAALLEKVRSSWMGMSGFRAKLEQTQHFVGFEQPVVSSGKLSVLRPSYFAIDFEPPYRQRQVCDGTFVWTYMPEQKQAFRVAIGQDATRGADLLNWALQGASATGVEPDDSFAKGVLRLDLVPGPNLPIQELRIWIREEGARLLGAEVVDSEGNRTSIRIRDIVADSRLRPGDFVFSPPSGVHVIEAEN